MPWNTDHKLDIIELDVVIINIIMVVVAFVFSFNFRYLKFELDIFISYPAWFFFFICFDEKIKTIVVVEGTTWCYIAGVCPRSSVPPSPRSWPDWSACCSPARTTWTSPASQVSQTTSQPPPPLLSLSLQRRSSSPAPRPSSPSQMTWRVLPCQTVVQWCPWSTKMINTYSHWLRTNLGQDKQQHFQTWVIKLSSSQGRSLN